MGAPLVGADPAGVEIPHEERLVYRVALVFVHFPHDEVLDVGKWVGLSGKSLSGRCWCRYCTTCAWREERSMLIFSVRHWPAEFGVAVG